VELASLAESVENPQLPETEKLTYLKKQKDLQDLNDMRQLLLRRMTAYDVNMDQPMSAQVMITEKARPGLKPVRPNKPINIILSVIIGGIVGLLLGTLVYLLQLRAFRRRSGAGSAPIPGGFRAFLRVTIALVVGVIVGYNCATPMSAASLFLMPLFVLLGGIAFALVEQA
jgi:hypothetical protein